MTSADYFRALFVVLLGGIALCLVLEGALVAFYGVRRFVRERRSR